MRTLKVSVLMVLVAIATVLVTLWVVKYTTDFPVTSGTFMYVISGILIAVIIPTKGFSLQKNLLVTVVTAIVATLLLLFVFHRWLS